MSNELDISIREITIVVKRWFFYFLSKWKIITAVCLLFVFIGVIYAASKKMLYTAELTFTAENEGSGGASAYAGIASQFGLNLGASAGSAFEGDNLMYLMRSRNLLRKTLFTQASSENRMLLINYYLKMKEDEEDDEEDRKQYQVRFVSDTAGNSRQRDSVVLRIASELLQSLDIQRLDKKSDIISVKMASTDEFFAKTFVEALVNTVIQYYTDYKVKKIRQNVAILQYQTDSIRNLINNNIVDIAVSSDLNVNPTRQITRTGIQRKQVDAQVNSGMYTELVKNLELSKLTLRKETPLIQIIDTPLFPLPKAKMGTMKAAIIFGMIGLLLVLFLLTLIKLFSTHSSHIPLKV